MKGVFGLAGAILITAGVAFIDWRAALIVAGAFALIGARELP